MGAKIHLQDKRFGTLRDRDGMWGRIACVEDQFHVLSLQFVTRIRKKITCKRCQRLVAKRGENGQG